MFTVILIFASVFNDIQADFNRTVVVPFHHKIDKRSMPILCAGQSLISCAKNHLGQVKECKVCGLLSNLGKSDTIINGKPVEPPNLYPWMVALLVGNRKACGGSIISENFILTAAHCLVKNRRKMIYRETNEMRIGFLTKFVELRDGPEIEEFIPHPGYNTVTNVNDIALIKLKKNIVCGIYQNPICLPPANFKIPEGVILRILGWGASRVKPVGYPKELQEGFIRVVNFEKCSKSLPNVLKDHVYCLMGVNGQSPCSGDSGGPMVLAYEKKFVVMGVSSMHTCKFCSVNKPVTYTIITKHLEWIFQHTALSQLK